jgi:hypothetical protein
VLRVTEDSYLGYRLFDGPGFPRLGLDLDEEATPPFEQMNGKHHLSPGRPDLLEQFLDLAATFFQVAGDAEDRRRTRGVAPYLDGSGVFILGLHTLLGRPAAAGPEHPGKPPASDLSRTRRF